MTMISDDNFRFFQQTEIVEYQIGLTDSVSSGSARVPEWSGAKCRTLVKTDNVIK